MEIKIKQAVNTLIETLNNDKDYRRSWNDNIAMSFKYYYAVYTKDKTEPLNYEDIHIIANKASENFLNLLCTQKGTKRTRGNGLKKEEWISFCSRHQKYNEDCDICNTGMWVNIYLNKFDNLMFSRFPKLWQWYVNKRYND